jgi:Lar family restriction alleviation protein
MTNEAIEAAALLPCPFCGEEYAEMSHYTTASSPKEPAGYYVECGYCSAAGPPFEVQGEMPDRHEYTKTEAIAAWNTRAAAPALMEEGARLALEAAKGAAYNAYLKLSVSKVIWDAMAALDPAAIVKGAGHDRD